MDANELIGWIATGFSVFVMVPQVIASLMYTAYRRKISIITLYLGLITQLLWIIYAFDWSPTPSYNGERMFILIAAAIRAFLWAVLIYLYYLY